MPTQNCRGFWRTGLAIVAISLSLSALAKARIDMVTEAWPPLVEQQNGSPAGVLWQTASEALACLGITAKLDFVPWKRALSQVRQGQKDAILGIGYTPERSRSFQFPAEPLYNSETVAFHAADRDLDIDNVQSLAGLQVGVSAGYSYSQQIREADFFERVRVPDIASGLRMVRLGRVDVLLANRLVGETRLEQLGLQEKIAASDTALSGGPVYLAFAAQASPLLVQMFSETLAAYKREGECPTSASDPALLH
ncbi:MAG: transporter substrate-binding domain-containing protein [Marinobacter sp.]|uniref:substrate-binding periplasmic protein n=1 Tax=Marinobacter sp. TaxID=50741 RepID=UPI00299ED04C|nr:transporter substrate-binding domain-containing protein [Marinobacter sp.]MDX1634593.1 transporter substrate-binding domain-containing protein [Marinobacter sp.]